MIFDHRVYTIRANRLHDFLKIYETVALPMQRKYLGEPYAFFYSEVGHLNQVTHIWKYESADDRQARRDRMTADPEWQAYVKKVAELDLVVKAENQLLRPATFMKIRDI
ncbi:NIPSNAP family protein [Rhodoligotrophos ferricapiens]|uniref:NIPSNAP family protein n=1 Tax=Rhodoligotrophos ferricapiens TaxID=3069264 RepID=UPI00315D89EE